MGVPEAQASLEVLNAFNRDIQELGDNMEQMMKLMGDMH